MKKMIANFYPAQEPKNGYIGKASITIADAIRLNGISVFSKENGDIDLQFPGFGDGGSYVVPRSKEAYAAMREVVAMATESEKHFGYNKGEYRLPLEVNGKLVEEPVADGRFSVDVADVCTLYGITTQVIEYAKDGKDRSFVAVDMPTVGTFENQEGKTQYKHAFEGRISHWTGKDGKEHSRNYGQILEGMVRADRKALIKERKPALEETVNNAKNRAMDKAKNSPVKEKEAEPSRD